MSDNSQRNYLDEVETVFLLGAGTSMHMQLGNGYNGVRVPNDNDFFCRIEELENWCDDGELVEIGEAAKSHVYETLKTYGIQKDQLLHKCDDESLYISMEEAFCRLDLLRMLRVKTPYNKGKKPYKWENAADAFKDLIAIVTAQGQPDRDQNAGGYYSLINKMMEVYQNKGKKFAFLTLNYELGLEYAINDYNNATVTEETPIKLCNECANALGELLRNASVKIEKFNDISLPCYQNPSQAYQYYYGLIGRDQPDVNTDKAIPILKLHGSCNWAVCPECQNIRWLWLQDNDVLFNVKRVIGLEQYRTKCQWHAFDDESLPKRTPHIIPPTWNKWMGDEAMAHIWRQSYKVLSNCKKLFIIGTSLPETDSHLRHLLQTAYFSRQENSRPDVYVVNIADKEADQEIYTTRLKNTTKIEIPNNDNWCCWQGFGNMETIEWIAEKVSKQDQE